MTGKDTSEAPASGPEDSASELAKVPREPLEEVAASETTGAEQAPVETPQAPAPTAMKPAPWSEDLPSAPLLLSVEGVSETSVTVTWEPPERLGRLGLQGYILELRREGASEWVPVNERPMMVTQQTLRNLVVGDKFFLRVAAVSSAGAGPPAVLDQPVHIHENIEAPKIRVPRHLRQTYLRQVGEAVNLQIPFQGNPKPQASWTHNGHALDSQRVNVRNGDRDSILFIRSVQRSDSGCYELTVRLEGMEARASINILVIEKPGPPSSIKLLDVWGCNAALEWTPPQDTGNTELLGYTVQKADKKTGQWFTVLERYHPNTCTISDLIVGNSYSFRVFSENLCGLSDSATNTKELAHIQKMQKADVEVKTKGFVQRDLSEAPSFTQPLADHTTTPGYSTQLSCSVRASPRPKIIWMKNNMNILGDPKYRAFSEQGVCTLEIRKPSPFDSGVYTCKAINNLGEASVDCRLDVKGEGLRRVSPEGPGPDLGEDRRCHLFCWTQGRAEGTEFIVRLPTLGRWPHGDRAVEVHQGVSLEPHWFLHPHLVPHSPPTPSSNLWVASIHSHTLKSSGGHAEGNGGPAPWAGAGQGWVRRGGGSELWAQVCGYTQSWGCSRDTETAGRGHC
ncbi:myosin-binding protein H isoform X2 [Saccopteryx bilineata]|uniref:myosin-binding protein H isoform X2 n=1 Tax=Saccopteryx bilineata TaxID=59482 RepID=UPI00338F7482